MKDKKEELKQIAEQRTLHAKKKMDLFYDTHIINSNDPIVIVLKSHLYIESCLDLFLSKALPFPNKLLKNSFSNKVDLFEALNLGYPPDNTKIVFKLRQINKIRNNLAHNLNKQVNEEDIAGLMKDIPINKEISVTQRLKECLKHFIAYLHALLSLNEFFPFFASYTRNKKIFERDIGWDNELFLLSYRFADMRTILKFLRMK